MALLAAAGCGGSSGDGGRQLTPDVVAQYLAVKQATDELTRVVNLIGVADDSTRQLSTLPPRSPRAASTLDGARLGWNNVVVGLNMFTPAQAGTVAPLAPMVLSHRRVAIHWQNALDGLAAGSYTRGHMLRTLRPVRREELKARVSLARTAAALAKLTCTLEVRYQQLASASTAASACAAAKQLGSAG